MRFKIAILTIVNLIAFIALLYMFDIFGVVNYYTLMRNKIAPNVPGFLNRFTQKQRVEDMSLLARDDLNKMRESFNLREKDLQAQESLIASRALELNTQSELIEQDRQNLLNAWSNYQATMDESSQYQLVLSDLANKINSMPPQNSVALLNQLAANGSDDLVIDVLLEMDSIAAAEGRKGRLCARHSIWRSRRRLRPRIVCLQHRSHPGSAGTHRAFPEQKSFQIKKQARHPPGLIE